MTQAKQTITVRSRVGSDGILHLDVPVALREMELEVTVTVQAAETGEDTSEALGWSPGFFEETFGAWEGEPLTRAPQEEPTEREPLA